MYWPVILRLNQMLLYALCLSYHSNKNAVLSGPDLGRLEPHDQGGPALLGAPLYAK